jgi:hypothetical protein
MEKEAFYFPHFCNARHDRKIRRLRKELGVEGYGIYFMLLETLREQQDLMYPLEDIDLLAEEFGVSEAKVRVAICNYELFEVDEEQKFFSPKMLVYLEPYFRMKEQRKIAGKASAEKRMLSDRSTTVQQSKVKERKVNEIKEKESKEDIMLIIDKSIKAFRAYHECRREELGSEFNNFMDYWTEPNLKNGKLRWEMEKFFDISRRIKTWMTNNSKFKNNGATTNEPKLGTSQARMEAIKNW